MKQTKLSKQQKKIIMILGESYDKSKKGEYSDVDRIDLKRKTTNTEGKKQYMKNYKPMTNSARASVSRSLKRLRERGIIKGGKHRSYSLTEEQGAQIYKELKRKEKITVNE